MKTSLPLEHADGTGRAVDALGEALGLQLRRQRRDAVEVEVAQQLVAPRRTGSAARSRSEARPAHR